MSGLSWAYRLATRAHSAAPYRFLKNGYAFPAWHYFLEVTRRCNLRCSMCQYHDWLTGTPPAKQREGELTTGEWRSVIDQTGRFSLLTFTGGEPFVRSDFMDLLTYTANKRRTHFISNGTMLTDDRAEACVKLAPRRLGPAGLNFVGISIDGPPEVHDAVRGIEGGFDKSAAGVKALARHRRAARKACPKIHVTTVIQADTVDILPEMPRLVADMGADVVNFTMEIHFPDAAPSGEGDPARFDRADMAPRRIDPGRLADALEAANRAAAAADIELRLPDMPIAEIVNHYNEGSDLRRFRCTSPWSTMIVDYKGDAYPCFFCKVGNVRQSSLKELWLNDAMRAFRQRCQRGLFPACEGCCMIEYTGRVSGCDEADPEETAQ